MPAEQKDPLLKKIFSLTGEENYSAVLENLYDGVYIVDKDRRILYWNKGAEEITGFGRNEVVGKFCYDNILSHVDKQGQPLCLVACPQVKTLKQIKDVRERIYLRDKNGNRLPVDVVDTPLKDKKGEVVGVVEIFRDARVYERLEKERGRLQKLSVIDPLTSIYNRRYILDKLKEELERAKRFSHPLSVLLADIDFFKKINAEYGHPFGDMVIKETAILLEHATRAIDIVGRYEQDAFIIMLPHTGQEGARRVAEKILRRLKEIKFPKIGTISVSLGGTMSRNSGTVKTIIQQAEKALALAKKSGRSCLKWTEE